MAGSSPRPADPLGEAFHRGSGTLRLGKTAFIPYLEIIEFRPDDLATKRGTEVPRG